MPELPEVETVRLGLENTLKNATIRAVELRRAGLRSPFPPGFRQSLTGATVRALRRRAKYILVDLSNGRTWLVHLGMTGSFRSLGAGAVFTPEAHDHVVLTLSDASLLVFNDPRRFGQMDAFETALEAAHPALSLLGPEPLEPAFDGPALAARLEGKKTPIKVALLDQRVIAGIGNIYASEALFRAGIDPRREARSLKAAECVKLAACVREVLNDALESGGSTLRNYRQIDGNTGFFQHKFAVYDHAGEACPGCSCGGKKKIETFVQAGRSTFFCPHKQGGKKQVGQR